MKSKQGGMTLLGFIIVLAIAGVFAYIGMKLVPMYTEFFSVKTAMKDLANDPGIVDQDPGKIRDLFSRKLYVSYSDGNIKPENIKLTRQDGGWLMEVNYEVRKPMIANLDVVARFSRSEMLSRKSMAD